jgi:hypothetical protein
MASNNDKISKAAKDALASAEKLLAAQKALDKSTKNIADSWNAIASEIFKMDGAQFFKSVEKGEEELRAMGEETQKLKEDYKLLGQEFEKLISDSIGAAGGLQGQLTDIGEKYKNHEKLINKNNAASLTLSANLDAATKERLKTEGSIEKLLQNRIKLSNEEIKKLEKIKKLDDESERYRKETLEYDNDIEAKLAELISQKSEIANIDDKISKALLRQIADGKTIAELSKGASKDQLQFLSYLKKDSAETNELIKGMGSLTEQIDNSLKKSKELNKEFSLSKTAIGALKSFASGFGSIIKKDWVGAIMEFDKVLNETQKQTGINMDDNSEAFASLQTNVAQFGMSVGDAGKMMASMSNELNTTNFGVLAQATKNFAAIEGATGAASEDITNIAGQMMRMGSSSEQVHDMFQDTSNIAKKFGVSSKGVISDISKNLGRWKNMGFQGGEKSLAKMAATAKRLNMSIDATFDMAEKARNIEGAMDMAAELQLAGGSFSNINPMDLLAAARKGPQEMQKILGTMGKDIGKFNAKGEFEIDPVDADRLRMVAETTGVKLEDLRNGIEKTAMDGQKLAGISEDVFASAAAGVEGWDKDMAKSSLADMMERTKDGKIIMKTDSVDLFKQAGITDLENINDTQMQALLKLKDGEKKTLEDENKKNQDLKQSFDNFINAFMSIFSAFEPLLKWLTSAIQIVTEAFTSFMGVLDDLGPFGTIIKWAIGALVLFGTSFGASVMTFVSKGLGGFKDLFSGKGSMISKLLGGGGKAAGGAADIAKSAATKVTGGVAESVGQSTSALTTSKISSKIDMGGLLKFSAAMALIGAAVMMFGVGMNQMGGISALDMLAKGAITIGLLALAVWGISQIKIGLGNIIKFSLAMTLVGLAMIPFAFAAQMMTDIDWMSVLAGIGILTLVVFGLMGLGMLMAGPQIIFLLIGIGILIAVGAALLIAAAGLLLAANAFQALGAVDWNAFSGMGDALASVVPGMLGFSLAAMLFANPLTILGLMFMAGALGGLVAVMAPLAESLTLGADSLDRFANGLEKLSAAADSLSLEKLEKLKELSDAMASASSGGNAMAAMANVASASGGAGGGGDVRRIEVDVKLNGRELQNFIVKDTAIIK